MPPLDLTLEGVRYDFRAPSVYDLPLIRRGLTRARVRRPQPAEFRVAALAGIDGMAALASDPEEGERQKALVTEWYELAPAISEDDLDEPDIEARAALLAEKETERRQRLGTIYPEVVAIQANLERHHPPYAELLADQNYFDEVSNIDSVRLMLDAINHTKVLRDEDGFVTQDAYQRISASHRRPLASFAFGLLTPDEARRKN